MLSAGRSCLAAEGYRVAPMIEGQALSAISNHFKPSQRIRFSSFLDPRFPCSSAIAMRVANNFIGQEATSVTEDIDTLGAAGGRKR